MFKISLTGEGLPEITFTPSEDGNSVTIHSGGYRVLEIVNGGGHWEAHALGALPTDGSTGFTVKQNGFIEISEE